LRGVHWRLSTGRRVTTSGHMTCQGQRLLIAYGAEASRRRGGEWTGTCLPQAWQRIFLKLLTQPHDGIAPLLKAIKSAKKSIDILIFRMDWKELETALKDASNKGVAVRALIAQTNRGGEPKLRNLETRFLEAGITVGRTADDLIRYHGKMMIVDRHTLFLLSFNFVHIDIEHSRGFGIVTQSTKAVLEAVKLFEADLNRQAYTAGRNSLVVSPANSRKELSAFIEGAKSQLLIYDPKIADKNIMRLLEDQAKAGLDIKILGSMAARNPNLHVAPLSSMRLHTRTIIRDGTQAFVGSQSLRQPELDLRREIGIIVRDSKVVNSLRSTFQEDWAATGFDEARDAVKASADPPEEATAKATRALVKEMPPLQVTLKKAIKQAVARAGKDAVVHGEMKSTVKDAVKRAMKEAVNEMVQAEQDR
jgi:cardiolipin synthase